MIENTIQVIYKESPVLLEKVIQDLQKTLTGKLRWLNYAFGRTYKLVQHREDGSKFTYPAIYNGNGEYVSVMPNDNLGNFSWFDIYDPQEVNTLLQSRPQITFEGALVFWYNLDTIYPDNSVLYTEEVKAEILNLLTTPGILTPFAMQSFVDTLTSRASRTPTIISRIFTIFTSPIRHQALRIPA